MNKNKVRISYDDGAYWEITRTLSNSAGHTVPLAAGRVAWAPRESISLQCSLKPLGARMMVRTSTGSQVSLGGIAAKWWSQKKKTRGRDPGWGRGEVSAAPQRSSAAAVWHSM